MVKTLLDLGASPESPKKYESYLVRARTPDEIMLFLEHGADPNRLVRVTIAKNTDHIPAYAETLRTIGDGIIITSIFLVSSNP